MENINQITCPNCKHTFDLETALAKDVEEKIRQELNIRYREHVAKKEQELQLKLQQQEAELRKKIAADMDLKLKSMTQELEEKNSKIKQLQQQELELIKKERQLKEEKEIAELEMQKRLMAERQRIEAILREKLEAETMLKIKEKDLKMEQMMQQIEILKKKAEQGSMQHQGEVQELALEELLKTTFIFDQIEEISIGMEGADIAQRVHDKTGKYCGTILYESKRTKAFSDKWIEKLKNDLRNQKADIAIIVTAAMPKDMTKFGEREGVWICTFDEVKGVATVLREMLLRVQYVRSTQENKEDKMAMLYQYLTSNSFKQHIEAIVEGFTELQNGLIKEKTAMERIWKEREKQIEKVLHNTAGMYGSIKGIAGNSVSEIPRLEL